MKAKSSPASFRPQSKLLAAFITLVALLAACAPAQAPTPTSLPLSPSPVPATATLVPSPIPSTPTLEPTAALTPAPTLVFSAETFAGIWKCCTGYELHTADGGYNFEHSLPLLLNHDLIGTMTIDGDVLTVIEDSSDCKPSQVGKYHITLTDPDTYHLTMIDDPCTWRATTGSAPLDGATLSRTKAPLSAGIYTKTISPADAQAAGGDLLSLVGDWQLQLEGVIGKGQFTLQYNGKVMDSGSYLNVDQQFILNTPNLCAGKGDSLGTFKVLVKDTQVNFYKTSVDCAELLFVMKTGPWIKQ
jgi:hypothetical protein